jgi:hypothetical protein
VIILVASFSFLSGYFTVLIYEYAAAGLEKGAQTSATRLLNLCFQVCYVIKLNKIENDNVLFGLLLIAFFTYLILSNLIYL